MNWLEFAMLAVVALLSIAGTLAIVALSLLIIKWAVRDIANMMIDSIVWSKNAYKKITA